MQGQFKTFLGPLQDKVWILPTRSTKMKVRIQQCKNCLAHILKCNRPLPCNRLAWLGIARALTSGSLKDWGTIWNLQPSSTTSRRLIYNYLSYMDFRCHRELFFMCILKDIFELHLTEESYFKVLIGCSHNNRLYFFMFCWPCISVYLS